MIIRNAGKIEQWNVTHPAFLFPEANNRIILDVAFYLFDL